MTHPISLMNLQYYISSKLGSRRELNGQRKIEFGLANRILTIRLEKSKCSYSLKI